MCRGETPPLPDERALGHRDGTYLYLFRQIHIYIYFEVLRPKRKGVKECTGMRGHSIKWSRRYRISMEKYFCSQFTTDVLRI